MVDPDLREMVAEQSGPRRSDMTQERSARGPENLLRAILLALGTLAVAVGIFAASVDFARSPPAGAYVAPGLAAMTPARAVAEADALLSGLLLGVYDAFGQTQEAAIYDGLSRVAGGDALEALYLERAGAMAGGGLAAADQTIHEIRMTRVVPRQESSTVVAEAEWDVVGSVGHEGHSHVRGNRYRAVITLAPTDGAWKITEFTLTDVDRTVAGETVEARHE